MMRPVRPPTAELRLPADAHRALPPLLQHWDISQTKIRVISTLLFVLFGCLLFVALPAAIFKHIEGWSALDSLYFVVITLTTIGFGDFVAGTDSNPNRRQKEQHRPSC